MSDVANPVVAKRLLAGIAIPAGKSETRAFLVRAVTADYGIGRGLTMPELIGIACVHGLRTEAERTASIEAVALRKDGATALGA